MKFDSFTSLKKESRATLKIKRSIFIASASFVKNESEAKAFISRISSEFKDATHNCWAYKIGELEHSSDVGEPSGTAGRPILSSIKSLGLDRVAVVVTRYFGGVKLGIRGLIEAYSAAARQVLNGEHERFLIGKKVKVEVDYQNFDKMVYKFRKAGYFYFSPPQFMEKVTLELFVPLKEEVDFSKDVTDAEIAEGNLLKI
ncbi:IMPACT family protein [Mesoaciditoga lauensis]|uniref:IMPACT family protein n=1 Tax=Mesoaciditoga lauensis TaxID=1495039 RepID=UPI00056AB9A8|nr:YigZ family protein [Mesoaciditoga lauensis]